MRTDVRTRALRLALSFIERGALRGTEIEAVDALKRGMGGSYGGGDRVHIGGYGQPVDVLKDGNNLKRMKADDIIVEQVDGERCFEVFKLNTLVRAIRQAHAEFEKSV